MAGRKLPIITGTSLSVGDLLRWDGSDWVNYPDSAYQSVLTSRCRAYLTTADQVIATGTDTRVDLNAENYDNLGEFDHVTNHQFICTIAGYYLIAGQVQYNWVPADKTYYTNIYKNGSQILQKSVAPAVVTNATATAVDVVYLEVNDEIELWTYHSRGVNASVKKDSHRTFLTIFQLL